MLIIVRLTRFHSFISKNEKTMNVFTKIYQNQNPPSIKKKKTFCYANSIHFNSILYEICILRMNSLYVCDQNLSISDNLIWGLEMASLARHAAAQLCPHWSVPKCDYVRIKSCNKPKTSFLFSNILFSIFHCFFFSFSKLKTNIYINCLSIVCVFVSVFFVLSMPSTHMIHGMCPFFGDWNFSIFSSLTTRTDKAYIQKNK